MASVRNYLRLRDKHKDSLSINQSIVRPQVDERAGP